MNHLVGAAGLFDNGKSSGFVLDSANELYPGAAAAAPGKPATYFPETAFLPAAPLDASVGLVDASGSSFSSAALHSGDNADAYSYAVERDYGKRPAPGWSGQRAGHAPPAAAVPARDLRKLWQQITKVQPGQRLQDSAEAYTELTVEDLLRIIITLPPSEPVIAAIAPGLAHLDSSALAALLKELSKQGYVKRAVELFDWLRSLDDADELKHLCDVYTYTTMISTCTHQQQLRRALELVAEMRTKGIKCNVHTYSSLMNVCIKSNELELALDVYKQMVAEGCTPNLVTFNTLVDLHVKAGAWEQAVQVLDTLEAQVRGRRRGGGPRPAAAWA
jgi:pentatricopeptide repeat protein